jgi:hypothetical protein
MALLDMQGMVSTRNGHGGGSGGGSDLSVLLCDSNASLTLCL